MTSFSITCCISCKGSKNFGMGDDAGSYLQQTARIEFNDSTLTITAIKQHNGQPTLREVWGII